MKSLRLADIEIFGTTDLATDLMLLPEPAPRSTPADLSYASDRVSLNDSKVRMYATISACLAGRKPVQAPESLKRLGHVSCIELQADKIPCRCVR
jgi:hypothetical protein